MPPTETATLTHASWLGLLVHRELTHHRDKRISESDVLSRTIATSDSDLAVHARSPNATD